MASSGKRKTTMAKLNRERGLREKRAEKQAKKDARKLAAAQDPGQPSDSLIDDSTAPDSGEPALDAVDQGISR